jgi:capsular polysaccharide biosynthesis protein
MMFSAGARWAKVAMGEILNIAELLARHQLEISTRGHLRAAMRLKRSLVELIGVEAAFPIVAKELQLPDARRLSLRPVIPLLDAARHLPTVRWLWLGGQSFVPPEPRVVGHSTHASSPGRSRCGWLASFDEVTLRGRSSLLHLGDKALLDQEHGEVSALGDYPEFDPWVLSADDRGYWMMEPARPALAMDEAFSLIGGHSVHFDHWLTTYLPKLGMAMLAGLPEGMPVLVDEIIPKGILDALPRLLKPGCKLIGVRNLGTVQVGRLWCVPSPSFIGFDRAKWNVDADQKTSLHPSRFAMCLASAVSRAENLRAVREPTGQERVYLACREGVKQRLTNIEEVEALLGQRGFAKVCGDDLDLFGQMRLARHARFVVAPQEAGVFLSMFARPGTAVCILSPSNTQPLLDFNAVLEASGMRTTILTGPDSAAEESSAPLDESGYSIDLSILSDFLDDWLRPAQSTGDFL